MVELFPFSEYWWFYAGFVGLVLVLLAVDLGIFTEKHTPSGFVRQPRGPSSGSVFRCSSILFFTSTRCGSFHKTRV